MSLSEHIEAFVITNGRKTFDHVHKLLLGQSLKIKIHIIQDMKWLDALNSIHNICKTPFYLRVDDDMLLHWLSCEYLISRAVKTSDKVAYYMGHLYEPATETIVRGIKVYRTIAAKDIGFDPDKYGKIDKNFLRKAISKGYKIKIDDSIVGVHATSDIEDEKLYRTLWAENSPSKINRKITECNISIDDQVKMCGKYIGKMNIKHSTDFGSFIRRAKT